MPISITARGKASICPQRCNKAQAEDFHCVNFTTSMNLVIDVKDPLDFSDVHKVLQSYYKGIMRGELLALAMYAAVLYTLLC